MARLLVWLAGWYETLRIKRTDPELYDYLKNGPQERDG